MSFHGRKAGRIIKRLSDRGWPEMDISPHDSRMMRDGIALGLITFLVWLRNE